MYLHTHAHVHVHVHVHSCMPAMQMVRITMAITASLHIHIDYVLLYVRDCPMCEMGCHHLLLICFCLVYYKSL